MRALGILLLIIWLLPGCRQQVTNSYYGTGIYDTIDKNRCDENKLLFNSALYTNQQVLEKLELANKTNQPDSVLRVMEYWHRQDTRRNKSNDTLEAITRILNAYSNYVLTPTQNLGEKATNKLPLEAPYIGIQDSLHSNLLPH